MEPITGREELGDRSRLEQALAEFYRAFNGRDLALMAGNWHTAGEIAMDNPLGGISRGWAEIEPVYRRLFAGPARVTVEFHDHTLHTGGERAYAVGRERGTRVGPGGDRLELAIRTSRVFRWVDGRWRQVHHHGSIDDPALLAAYQGTAR